MDKHELVFGNRRSRVRAERPAASLAEGRITAVIGRTAKFVIPDFDPLLEFGPAPYSPCPLGMEPVQGDVCLVAIVPSGNVTHWVISWIG